MTPSTPRNVQRRILRISVSGGTPDGDLRFENLFDRSNRVAVDLDRVVDIFAVPAGHGWDYRHFALVTLTQDAEISFAETVNRQGKPAEFVTRIRIGAREIENDVRIKSENCRQVAGQTHEIRIFRRTVRQFD